MPFGLRLRSSNQGTGTNGRGQINLHCGNPEPRMTAWGQNPNTSFGVRTSASTSCGQALACALGGLCQQRTHAPQQNPCSFDHLVSAREQRRRHGKAERLGGLEVDHQLDFDGLLHRQLGRFLALENAASIDADQTVGVRQCCCRNSSGRPPQRTRETARSQAARGEAPAQLADRCV